MPAEAWSQWSPHWAAPWAPWQPRYQSPRRAPHRSRKRPPAICKYLDDQAGSQKFTTEVGKDIETHNFKALQALLLNLVDSVEKMSTSSAAPSTPPNVQAHQNGGEERRQRECRRAATHDPGHSRLSYLPILAFPGVAQDRAHRGQPIQSPSTRTERPVGVRFMKLTRPLWRHCSMHIRGWKK